MPDYQSAFAAALLDAAAPTPAGVITPSGAPATKRFDVYRNNVVVSLSEALAVAFPVVKKLVGDIFFQAMAGVYVRANPPRTPLMMFYGETFPDFLSEFEPARALSYLPDVARLEQARRQVYHAADDTPANPDSLASFTETELMALRFDLIAGHRIIPSEYPILGIWRANMGGDNALSDRGETVLIARPDMQVEMHLLSPGSAEFISGLAGDLPLGIAAERAATAMPEFDLGAGLSDLFRARILKNVTLGSEGE